ncbi:hypothetical protein ACFYT3_17035 [Nocardia amikacinitolerans]|uniref:hypothetical protein n=1 Tax=Nocardia amikacinitolerans TaxID=756689 RepID=UPI0020A53720|nr:hypothetical protein [Nocardia amikacinitolerans]
MFAVFSGVFGAIGGCAAPARRFWRSHPRLRVQALLDLTAPVDVEFRTWTAGRWGEATAELGGATASPRSCASAVVRP